ncbi:hypothetical protein [Pseudoalteromonas phenolica]|uniref:Uncharacterized protein n=1 Tax=Pseudoalteromonas phenolica TaxID=161398 RepID=A0A0S2K7G6_9GAMM|nr:hypothetical protein [Pseudoalteromonas phenolica]ALO44332.1 hypothetical protein PP2015_3863 [Pseudoalteromonas phenolica]RXF05059.1 hypothetical protein D9981_03190 [Pseudoalteromonas phenolica O-BC30]
MSLSFVKLFIILIGFCCTPVFSEEDDFWDRNYQQCFQSADVVVEGKVTDFKKIGYNGNEKFGYTHYLISIEVFKPIKGFEGEKLQYHVWYEGKEHDINGSSLFCLCANKDGEYGDPEGFGRMSLGKHYQNYLNKRDSGSIKPIDVNGKYYVPYCSA